MRKLYLFLLLSFFSVSAWSQTTVFSEDFNVSRGSAYTVAAGPIGNSPVWSILNIGDFGARIHGNILDLTNDGSAAVNAPGFVYGNAQTSTFTNPFNSTLSSNPGMVTWAFNMRQIRTDPSGLHWVAMA